jgi:hypothetical protein
MCVYVRGMQVFIDTTGPEFIGWDDINGIDEVGRIQPNC